MQRWRAGGVGDDGRHGPRTAPSNKLSDAERKAIVDTAGLPEFRDLSVKQIVPTLADRGIYLASESTMYRVLHAEDQVAHRSAAKAPQNRSAPRESVATAPNQVWSWDITYMQGPMRGTFYFLYMIIDVFSRKIVAQAVHDAECSLYAAMLIRSACTAENIHATPLILHSDNGAPMKGSTMLATLQDLGVMPSFSRPRVSDDNPFSESLFRTLKYRPEYPTQPFASLDSARGWVDRFTQWYNHEHRHSGIKFVTPAQRHAGEDGEVLARRAELYEEARARSPQRWTAKTRNWSRVEVVRLNPDRRRSGSEVA